MRFESGPKRLTSRGEFLLKVRFHLDSRSDCRNWTEARKSDLSDLTDHRSRYKFMFIFVLLRMQAGSNVTSTGHTAGMDYRWNLCTLLYRAVFNSEGRYRLNF